MRQLLIILFISITSTATAQSFEGKIIYQVSYKSKHPNVKDEQFNAMMGTVQEYIIKGADYKSSFNGTTFQWQQYDSKTNKLYNKMTNSKSIQWMDAGTNDDKVLNVKLNKGVTEVLGHKCDELILTCNSGVQKYYFNEKLAVDVSLFKNHLYSNWYEYLKIAKSLPLKSIIESPQYIVERIATEIIEMELGDKEFQVPDKGKVANKPYLTRN